MVSSKYDTWHNDYQLQISLQNLGMSAMHVPYDQTSNTHHINLLRRVVVNISVTFILLCCVDP